MRVPVSTTAFSVDVQIVDDVGLPVTGLVAAGWPPINLSPGGALADIPLGVSDLPAITTPHPNDNTAGGVFERVGGYYRLDLPNGIFQNAGFIRTIGEADNLHLLVDSIEVSAGGGLGAYTVTIVVQDATTLAAVQGATVRLTNGMLSYVQGTDQYGTVQFNVDAATYGIAITAPGYAYSGSCLTVSGATNAAIQIASVVVPPPAGPLQCTGTLTCYNAAGAIEAGVVISCQLVSMPIGDVGNSVSTTVVSATSDVNGNVNFPGLWIGANYSAWRGVANPGDPITFHVPAGLSSFSLPDVLSRD